MTFHLNKNKKDLTTKKKKNFTQLVNNKILKINSHAYTDIHITKLVDNTCCLLENHF